MGPMSTLLTERKCVKCEPGTPPLDGPAIEQLLTQSYRQLKSSLTKASARQSGVSNVATSDFVSLWCRNPCMMV